MFPDAQMAASVRHTHVADHYTGEHRLYRPEQRRLMQQWVRRHGGLGIVEIIDGCDEPRCWGVDQARTTGSE